LARIEAGELDPRLSTLLRVCRALKVSIAELVGEATPSKSQKGGSKRSSVAVRALRKGGQGLCSTKKKLDPFTPFGFEVKDGVRRMKLACSVCGFLTTERQH